MSTTLPRAAGAATAGRSAPAERRPRAEGAEPAHVASLDGIRALAVLTVLVGHYTELRNVGQPAVHCFFVLSGFLITGILLRARAAMERDGERPGWVLRQFYARRFLRIVPVYYATLFGAWFLRLSEPGELESTLKWHLLYLSNVKFALTKVWGGTTAHLWSLSVEEQFYLVWPLLVLRLPRRWLVPVACAGIAIAPVWRAVTVLAGVDELPRYVLPPGATDSLGLGCLLAMTTVSTAIVSSASVAEGRGAPMPRWLPWGLVLAVPVLVAGQTLAVPGPLHLALQSLFFTSASVVFAWLVWTAWRGDSAVSRVLAWRPLAYVGRISYGIYLFHMFARIPFERLLERHGHAFPPRGPARFFFLTAATIAVASGSWYCFERPINALKRRLPYVRPGARSPGDAAPYGQACASRTDGITGLTVERPG